MTLLKRTLFGVFGVMQCVMRFKVKNTFSAYVASRHVKITTSAFVIKETTLSSKFFKKENVQAVSQKRQTVLVKLELPHFIETVFVHRWCCRLLFQVQEIVLCKMR